MPVGTQRFEPDSAPAGEGEDPPPPRTGSTGHRAGRRFRMARCAVGGVLLRSLGPPVLGALARTWRTEVHGTDPGDLPGGALITLWHGNMLVGMNRYRDRGWQVLVSPSDDGDLSETLLERFGYGVVRGSTRNSSWFPVS